MGKGVNKITIINRSFWPYDQILGDALLQFAESMSVHMKCYVVTQGKQNLKEKYRKENRGILHFGHVVHLRTPLTV